jgi:hypothetical protein
VTAESVVRAFFDAYSSGEPGRFAEIESPEYFDLGHEPPGRGPQGARDDYDQAVERAGGVITYDIDALVARDETVAAVWSRRLSPRRPLQLT